MRVSSNVQPIFLSFIVMKLAKDVLREIPRDQDSTRPVTIRRAVPYQTGAFHESAFMLVVDFEAATLGSR